MGARGSSQGPAQTGPRQTQTSTVSPTSSATTTLPLPQQVPHDDHHDVIGKKTVGRPTKECSKQPPYTVTIDNELIARILIELANDGIDDEEWDDDFWNT
jgi:hypothetical protein